MNSTEVSELATWFERGVLRTTHNLVEFTAADGRVARMETDLREPYPPFWPNQLARWLPPHDATRIEPHLRLAIAAGAYAVISEKGLDPDLHWDSLGDTDTPESLRAVFEPLVGELRVRLRAARRRAQAG